MPSDFEDIIGPHLEAVYRVAYRLTGTRADAQDLVQELLTKLYPRRAELAGVERLRPWLVRVMHHIFIDQRRRFARSPVHLAVDNTDVDPPGGAPDGIESDAPGPEEAADRDHRALHLAAALERLSEEHRVVVSLHDVEGYTLEEIQTILDCPIGTLKSRLHRARARLRTLLERSLGEP